MEYVIHKTEVPPPLEANWENPAWQSAATLEVMNFRPESSNHRPRTSARILHDGRAIHGIFRVHDRYVRCVRTEYHSEVWKDSCVEFFAEPTPARGYFNFEFNCGGAFLCCHITNPERTPDGFRQFAKVSPEIGRLIQTRASLPRVVDPEITVPVTWTLQFLIPFALFDNYAESLGKVSGQVWRGNFFKCAEDNSHSHWAAWSPVDELNFHLPRCFGALHFE